MTDVYVYYFMRSDCPAGDVKLSTQSATLEAIKGKGEPIMESQMVVDHTEVDGNGFLVARDGSGSYAVNNLSAQIRSIELRAVSRDSAALTLDEATDGRDKYMLRLESRELRGQAKKLKSERADLMADEVGNQPQHALAGGL
jgi:hypothetical protein